MRVRGGLAGAYATGSMGACEMGEFFGEHSDQGGVVGSAAAEDEFVGKLRQEAGVGVGDGPGGEAGGGVEKSGQWPVVSGQNLFCEGFAEVFAAGGFWRRAFEVGMGLEFFVERGVEGSACGELAVVVVSFFALGFEGDEGVDEHVAGAGVEGEDGARIGDGANLRIGERFLSPVRRFATAPSRR